MTVSDPQIWHAPTGRKIAFHQTDGDGPGVVFLGGFKSDMEGSKATYLEQWARAQGRAFLRFDYSGHGQSSEEFTAGAIGDWFEDALGLIASQTDTPQILVGSSMGGWISLLIARAKPRRVHALVTIAAAPDFTEDGFWAGFSDAQKAELEAKGHVALPSEYGEPYIITKRLIVEGRANLVLRDPLELPFKVRALQGTADTSVSSQTALRLMDHVTCPDYQLLMVKDKDHSFSDDACLPLIVSAIQHVT
ncbi:alpha/beta hydrolase [Nereida sp. MMG024]|nr:alpha/beta hydrolase [Nereida sp. MMG025]